MKFDFVVPEALGGERLDRVVSMLGDLSRKKASAIVASGRVSLGGVCQTRRSARVESGDRIMFEIEGPDCPSPQPDHGVEFGVIFSDPHIAVINKPSGLVMHPGAGNSHSTLVNGLLARFPEMKAIGEPSRPGIVHRLDAETSGLLVVARSPRAYESLTTALAQRSVSRGYFSFVYGALKDERGVIEAPIGRSVTKRTKMVVASGGKPARTHYRVEARSCLEPAASLLRCRLETGRTHQIRVHLSAIGHPVIGDRTYGRGQQRISFERVALHAARLAFNHPVNDESLEFHCPLPTDLLSLATRLELGDAVAKV